MASSSRPRRRASVAPSRTVPVRRRQRPASGRSSWQPGTRPANTDLRRKHMPGLHYEEFSVGQAFDHEWTRTVTEMDNTLFSRSEEHTSELQSLMRISYAVFCLTKNTITTKK